MTKNALKKVKKVLSYLLPVSPSNEEKKSDTLVRFAEPLIYGDEDLFEMEALISIAVLSWNISYLSPHRCVKKIALMMKDFPLPDQILTRKVIADLIERKKKLFVEHDWIIADVNLEAGKNGKMQLTVSYAMLGEGEERSAILSTIDGTDKEKGRVIIEDIITKRANAAIQHQNSI